MVEILPETKNDIVGFKTSGKLMDKEYKETLIPCLDAAIKASGKGRLLCHMDEGFKGWELGAAWDDLTFWLKHKSDFSKLAVVGGTKWIEVGTKLSAYIMGGEVRVFPEGELQNAWAWIKA